MLRKITSSSVTRSDAASAVVWRIWKHRLGLLGQIMEKFPDKMFGMFGILQNVFQALKVMLPA